MIKKTHEFCPADRYLYDFGICSFKKGFSQVDTSQDASYFGTWANPHKRIIFCYCEGDTTMTQCDTDEEFASEMRELIAWNKGTGHWLGIDGMCDGEMIARWIELGLGDFLH